MSTPPNGYRYDAFISYRHVEPDRKMAKWLHAALETYRVPKKLVREKSLPRRLDRVFRDEEELAASSNLSREIDEALTQSRYLIVVCSPRTPASEWVNAEVVRFRQLNRDDRILALLVEGEPRDSFPRSLREIRRAAVDSSGTTTESIDEIEPLAADIRSQPTESRGHIFRMARLRLLACLLGCRFDELRRREQQRQTRRLTIAGALLTILLFLMTGLTTFALYEKGEAEHQRGVAENRARAEKSAREDEQEQRQLAESRQVAAEKARDEKQQVLDYLVASFRKSDPDADGEKLTVAELFGQAAEQLETTFPNQPLIQAQLLDAIGKTYRGLGLYQKAVAIHERASDLLRNELGKDHQDSLTLMANLAVAYESAGRLAEALPLHEQTLELRKVKLGPEHSDTLTSMNNLAGAYQSAGRVAEALPLLEQALELLKAKLGPEHRNTLATMNNLGHAYCSAGRLAEALPLLEQSLELMKAKFGPEHPDTLNLMNNLAVAYESAGRLAEALPLLEKALELRNAKLGPEHPHTLVSMNCLANAFASAGKFVDALPLHERTLELRRAKLGPEHPSTLLSMNNLAMAYYSAGRLADALSLYEQTLELMNAKLGPEHPDTLTAMGSLANAYFVDEQPEQGLPLLDRFIAGRRRRAAPDDPGFAGLLATVSRDLLQHRQYPAAETYLREGLTILERKFPDHWGLYDTKSMLGGAMAGQKKFPEAEPLLVEGYEGMKEREANIPPAAKPRLAEAIRRLVYLYTAWDRPDEAAKWQAVLEESIPEERK